MVKIKPMTFNDFLEVIWLEENEEGQWGFESWKDSHTVDQIVSYAEEFGKELTYDLS